MATSTIKKDVRYLNKDFQSFRNDLIDFAKIYFPNTYNDFSEASPGMMFIEMASYVGDVLSYYIDSQFQETLLAFAEEKETVYQMAQAFGYSPRLSTPASTTLDVFQTVPSIGTALTIKPNLDYGLVIPSGMEIESSDGITFRTLEPINFKFSGSNSPMEVSIFESDSTTNLPATYLLKKQVKVKSGTIKSTTFTFTTAEKYSRIVLPENNVTEIINVTDTAGNKWYEVPFLAQDTIFDEVENISDNDPELSQYSDDVPYLLKLVKTPRRFTTYIRSDNKTELKFGSGTSAMADEDIVPNPNNVGSSLPGSPTFLNTAFDPTNFLTTETYGAAPNNTTLTVKYAYGGGIDHNVNQNDLINISNISYTINETGLDANAVQTAKDSVAVINPEAATGGAEGESVINVKNNALAYFQAQNRAVTKDDYIIRGYALPAKYGSIAKIYIAPDDQLEQSTLIAEGANGAQNFTRIPNPFALNMYTVGYNINKNLVNLNLATKENLRTYLGQYRMVTDAINIKNAWIINIGVKFDIIILNGYNAHEVLLRCIKTTQEFFNIDNWQINQPIMINDLAQQIILLEGVAGLNPPQLTENVHNLPILIINKWNKANGYSGNIYDIAGATKGSVLYPSVDPSVFELKYPNVDIEARTVGEI